MDCLPQQAGHLRHAETTPLFVPLNTGHVPGTAAQREAGNTVGTQRKKSPGKNYGDERIFWYPLKGNNSNQRKGDFPIVK